MLRARNVLNDCKKAHELLESETNEAEFRILWVAGIALARAVGHVLDKVDSQQNAGLREIITKTYENWKQDRENNMIYWEFIEDERNRVLKEYAIGFLAGPMNLTASGETFTLGENLFCPISDGVYAGEDCRGVLEEAINWWETQLQAIEVEMKI